MAAETLSELVFANLAAGWLVPLLLATAILAAWWGWTRYGPLPDPQRRWPGILARGCRAFALALLVLAAGGPAWRRVSSEVSPGRVVVAVDCSASMAVADGPDGSPRLAAAAALQRALAARSDLQLEWWTVCTTTGARSVDPETIPRLAAEGPASPLGDELYRLVTRSRPDLLLLVSDGRLNAGSSLPAVAARWRGRDLRLAALAVGTGRVEPELAIDEVVVNREVALGELETVAVRLAHRGLPPGGTIAVTFSLAGVPPTVCEARTASGTDLDPAAMQPAEARTELVFRAEGPVRLRVTAEAGGMKVEQTVEVVARERKLAVLLLDRQPRYELRYLREALKRDPGIEVHAYLGDGRWRRWTEKGPADRLPLARGDLERYDVVLIGDVSASSFTSEQIEALAEAVRQRGSGLVWLPGESGALASWKGTRLGELLPVEVGDAQTISRGYLAAEPLAFQRTPRAEALGLLDAGMPGLAAGDGWEKLPRLLGACPVVSVRPGAEVLGIATDGRPLVVSRAFDGGTSLFLAVDDTWRWRRNAGDRFLHRFHSQLLRFVAAGHRAGRTPWRLVALPRRTFPGEAVVIGLASIRPGTDPGEAASLRLRNPHGGEQVLSLGRDGDGFSTRLNPTTTGIWTAELADGPDADRVDPTSFTIIPPALERHDPRADRGALADFTTRCGGATFDRAEELVASLPPDLARAELRVEREGLWDTWWFLLLAVVLLATDWALRRAHRLP